MFAQGTPAPSATVERRGSTTVVTFLGDLDLATERELDVVLARPLDDDPDLTVLVLDLGADGFCSVRGVALVVRAGDAATARGVELVVARPRASLLRMLRLFGWEHRVRLAPDLATALRRDRTTT